MRSSGIRTRALEGVELSLGATPAARPFGLWTEPPIARNRVHSATRRWAAADLTVTHFALLTALQENPRARASDLVDVLAMDQTTLSRTLALMERECRPCAPEAR